jgi:hypothetical protein
MERGGHSQLTLPARCPDGTCLQRLFPSHRDVSLVDKHGYTHHVPSGTICEPLEMSFIRRATRASSYAQPCVIVPNTYIQVLPGFLFSHIK